MTERRLILSLESLISRADIHRTAPPQNGASWVPLYQGNGRFGSCYGPWGLHVSPDKSPPYAVHGNTQFMHLRHHVRARFGGDYLIPLAKVYWETEPEEAFDYGQTQSFHDGTIATYFCVGHYAVDTLSWFDPVEPNIAGFRFAASGKVPALIIKPFQKLHVHYDQQLEAGFSASSQGGVWTASLRCLNANTSFSVRTDSKMIPFEDGVKIVLPNGRSDLLIAVNDEPKVTAAESLERTRRWWHSEWERGAWLDLPDEEAQRMWVRSNAYILSSYNDGGLGMAGPMGFTGNGWPFHFPQDLSFIHPVLLSTGRTNTAKSWIEYWAGYMDGMKRYTKRLVRADGVFVPWQFPHGSLDGYYDPETPNIFSHNMSNSGFVSRMAHETAIMVDDADWTKTYAEPLIRETARFYLSILKKEIDGLWHIHVTPSIGQDELGGENQKDYICSLYSALYCLRTAIRHGLDESGRMRSILADGLAFPRLLSDKGFYHTNLGSGSRDFGKQKHPPQLNPLAFLPVMNAVDAPTRRAYEMRYEITAGANEPSFCGWTLGEFLLSSARMRDAKGWSKDWDCALPAGYVDPEWIQIYETSRAWSAAFYTTTHGLFAQAILDCLVSEWWGGLQIAGCIPWNGDISFGNVRTLSGLEVSGQISGKGTDALIRAGRDASITCNGELIALQRGEERHLTL